MNLNSLAKINKICKAIKKLTSEDFSDSKKEIEEQKNYIHPLKHAKQAKINSTGDYNEKVLIKLEELKNLIDSFENKT